MQSIRLTLVLTTLAWFALPVENANAERTRRDADGSVLLAKTKKSEKEREERPEKKTKKEGKKQKRKEKSRSAQSEETSQEETRQQRPKKAPELASVTGILAVEPAAEGLFRVTVTDEKQKTYILEIPESAVPKAQELAGKWVLVKGQVRDRNGQFLISHVQSCRPVAKPKTKEEAPDKTVPDDVGE
jgi:SOS-response transcriptional repressor LexA